MFTFYTIVQREMRIALYSKRAWIEPLVFFAIIAILFPLSLTSDAQKISEYGFSIVWISVLIAAFLSLERFFQPDYLNGSLEQLLLAPQPLEIILLAKTFVHWMIYGVSLTLVATFYAASLLSLPGHALFAIIGALLLGTLVATLFGTIGAALTVSLGRGSMLTGLLVIPFYLPVLIFGAQLSEAALLGLPVSGYFALLGAMLAVLLVLAPFFSALALQLLLD